VSAASGLGQGALDEASRPFEVLGCQGVPHCVFREAVPLVPLAGRGMHRRHVVGVLLQDARAEHFGEEVVVAVPLPLVIEWDDEQVVALQGREHRAAAVQPGDGVAQRPGQPVEEGGAQQEFSDSVRLVLQHLLHQVVDEESVAAGEGGDEAGDVLLLPQREGGQLQTGDPPFGAGLEGDDVVSRETQTHRPVEEVHGLLAREAQVRGAELGQFSTTAQAGQRERWVRPAGDGQVQLRRQVVEQEADGLVYRWCVDHVVVVEHEDDPSPRRRRVVDQSSEGHVDR
jgi:hypothetical protein